MAAPLHTTATAHSARTSLPYQQEATMATNFKVQTHSANNNEATGAAMHTARMEVRPHHNDQADMAV